MAGGTVSPSTVNGREHLLEVRGGDPNRRSKEINKKRALDQRRPDPAAANLVTGRKSAGVATKERVQGEGEEVRAAQNHRGR